METSVFNSTLYNSSYDLKYNSSLNIKYIAAVVYISIILSIEIPLICAAIYVVFFLTKSGQGAPVFVINLLITDLVQIACASPLFVFERNELYFILPFLVTYFSGPYFMTCVAVERYLLIAHPIWYRSHRPVKSLLCTSLIGWFLSLIFAHSWLFTVYLVIIIPLIYYIVIIFCFAGAYRALSHSQSVTSIKRQLVMASLFFVLLSYTFSTLTLSISFLLSLITYNLTYYIYKLAVILNMLNPIADCVLYVFMRNDVGNAFRTPHRSPRQRRIQREIPLTNLTNVQRHPV
ncbi:psychosine receptor-like [Triplophysa rosa]|uniref:psychosine receptor-like n=1 Tax=Triplophysa rosa TaxID=992332 RepID=UPI002545FAC4|nr:psychosine receptor-like [Triplophysa rosa]